MRWSACVYVCVCWGVDLFLVAVGFRTLSVRVVVHFIYFVRRIGDTFVDGDFIYIFLSWMGVVALAY